MSPSRRAFYDHHSWSSPPLSMLVRLFFAFLYHSSFHLKGGTHLPLEPSCFCQPSPPAPQGWGGAQPFILVSPAPGAVPGTEWASTTHLPKERVSEWTPAALSFLFSSLWLQGAFLLESLPPSVFWIGRRHWPMTGSLIILSSECMKDDSLSLRTKLNMRPWTNFFHLLIMKRNDSWDRREG